MAKKAPKIVLSNIEWDILSRIADKSKIDCWFSGRRGFDSNGKRYDFVYDLERRAKITLRYGVKLLDEGIAHPQSYGLTDKEVEIYYGILKKLGLKNYWLKETA